MAHPLSGADLGTLRDVYDATGGPDRWQDRLAIAAAVAGRAPASLLEHRVLLRAVPPLDRMAPPVFLIGHWRSGTTHLYNLLAQGPFGYLPPVEAGLPWDVLGLARLLRPLLDRALPESRWIDAVPVTPTSPQEDEIAIASMCPLSFYHGLYFPRAFGRMIERGIFFDGCTEAQIAGWEDAFTLFLRKTAHRQSPRRMVVKNPVYTARVARLRRLVPGAKFIHIHRDPVAVFLSMRNFYARLLEAMALQAVPADLDIDGTILRIYDRMMTAMARDTAPLGAPDFVEISYDTLERDPMAALERIHTTLELDGWEDARPHYEAYLASVQSYRKNTFARDPDIEATVTRAWGPWLARWGYSTGAAATNPQ